MASVNKTILIGNLGADPETRYAADGSAICNIRLATTDKWKDKATGEKRENTEWHRVVFFGRLGEIASQYLRKGSTCYVEGRLQTREWTDKDGNKRYTTQITADQLQLLGRGKGSASDHPAEDTPQPPAPPRGGAGNGFDDMDDDIPF